MTQSTSGVVTGWVVAAAMSIITGLTALTYANLERRLTVLEREGPTPMQVETARLNAQVMELGRRVDALSARMASVESAWRETSSDTPTLEAIHKRLDRLERAWTSEAKR